MSNKTHDDKFSGIESDTMEDWYIEMEKFIHYLAGANNGLAVEYDDIVQELAVELVKGVKAYPNLPHEQLKAVLRKMMDNRISELKYRFHVTHRKEALFDISLSIEVQTKDASRLLGSTPVHQSDQPSAVPIEELVPGGPDPAAVFASKERVLEIRSSLSSGARRVFDSLIRGNNMLAMVVWLSSVRASHVFGSRSVKIRPWHIADVSYRDWETDRKSTRLNSSHRSLSRMPSSA